VLWGRSPSHSSRQGPEMHQIIGQVGVLQWLSRLTVYQPDPLSSPPPRDLLARELRRYRRNWAGGLLSRGQYSQQATENDDRQCAPTRMYSSSPGENHQRFASGGHPIQRGAARRGRQRGGRCRRWNLLDGDSRGWWPAAVPSQDGVRAGGNHQAGTLAVATGSGCAGTATRYDAARGALLRIV